MNKKLGLKVLLRSPFSVIKEGLRVQENQYFKEKIYSKYKIEQLPTIDMLDLFPNLNEEINCYSFLKSTSLITDLILLKSLARRFDNCAYLEIGSWRGESISNVRDVTNDCTSLTLSAEEMKDLKFGDDVINIHGVFSNHIKDITKIEKNSFTFDFTKLNKKFDLSFVDGDHSYEGVLNDSQKVYQLRKDETSIIVWHDYGFNTEDVRYATLKAILDGIPKEKHGNLFHVSNTMCAIYIENTDFKTTKVKVPSYPNKVFSLKIKADKL